MKKGIILGLILGVVAYIVYKYKTVMDFTDYDDLDDDDFE